MKYKTSVTLEEEIIVEMTALVKTGRFRNKSHIMEYAIRRFIENGNN
tara:strand:+ start:379 stop:519 length:141 start_codon:yes stop_codon:yes gene_type:complete